MIYLYVKNRQTETGNERDGQTNRQTGSGRERDKRVDRRAEGGRGCSRGEGSTEPERLHLPLEEQRGAPERVLLPEEVDEQHDDVDAEGQVGEDAQGRVQHGEHGRQIQAAGGGGVAVHLAWGGRRDGAEGAGRGGRLQQGGEEAQKATRRHGMLSPGHRAPLAGGGRGGLSEGHCACMFACLSIHTLPSDISSALTSFGCHPC